MAHLIGYVGEVTEDMLNQPQFELYNPGDVVGVSGVERQYNNALMGKNGARRALVNSHGREVGLLGETEAIPGKQLKLTVDIDLQIAAEEALEGKNGAIVAMDPRTGEILAMVSRPTFDPNDFAVRVSRDQWNKLVNDPDKPLLNKAIQAQLAPGSTFKIIMSMAGLQEGIAQDLHVNCTGGAEFYGRYVRLLGEGADHGPVDSGEGDLSILRRVLLHAGGKAGHRPHCQIRDRIRPGTENRNRSAARSQRGHAVGRMEDPELQTEMVRRGNDFGGHRAGRGGDHAGAVGARDLLRSPGRRAWWCRMWSNPQELPPDTSRPAHVMLRRRIDSHRSEWIGLLLPTRCREFCCRRARLPRRTFLGLISPGRRASAQIVSLATRAKIQEQRRAGCKNGWFVGFTPRRNPDDRCLRAVRRGRARTDWRRAWRRK